MGLAPVAEDREAASDWRRQLIQGYVIDTLRQPGANAAIVSWTDRLARRGISGPDVGSARTPPTFSNSLMGVVKLSGR